MDGHYFLVENLATLVADLEAKGYSRAEGETGVIYSKIFSKVLKKNYAYPSTTSTDRPMQVRVVYELLQKGKALQKLLKELKWLNARYRQTITEFKTKHIPADARHQRWQTLQRFLEKHSELIDCFRYKSDDRLSEGNYWFNLQIASTPAEQRICVEFIKALADAFIPQGIIRGRRQADKPVQQRNGWIRRNAQLLRKQGWRPVEIAREIQKELRDGSWNERSRLQFNIANSTICKIAGIKISPSLHN